MMTAALEILVLSGLAAAVGWGAAMLGPESWRPAATGLPEAFQDPRALEGMLRASREAAGKVREALPSFLPARTRGRLSKGLEVLHLHARILAETMPILVLALVAGASLGLAGRERQRSGVSFASPLRAHFGKQIAVVGTSALLAFALIPTPVSPETVWWGGAGAAVGIGLWLANLPLKV